MRCRYSGTRCRGCGLRIAFGAPICAGGDGLVHDSRRCLCLAVGSLEQARAQPAAAPQAATTASLADDLIVGRELASFVQLETEFAMATGSSRMAGCLLPRDDAEAFVTFLRWAAARGDEGDTWTWTALWRAASTLMARTRGEDLTEHAAVRRAFAELSSSRA